MKDLVHEPDGRGLVRVLVGQFDVNLPDTRFERGCKRANKAKRGGKKEGEFSATK